MAVEGAITCSLFWIFGWIVRVVEWVAHSEVIPFFASFLLDVRVVEEEFKIAQVVVISVIFAGSHVGDMLVHQVAPAIEP